MEENAVKRRYSIFLNGDYADRELDYYRKLITETVSIAVDGGYRLFERTGQIPDIALGDFDSIREPSTLSAADVEIIRHDSRKNKTDGELAIGLAITRGAREIVLCGYSGGFETDHLLGNLLLLGNTELLEISRDVNLFASRDWEKVWFLRDDTLEVSGTAGDMLSVVPLDSQIRLTLAGCEYPADAIEIIRGSTLPLRNKLSSDLCRVRVDGSAFVIWQRASAGECDG